MSNILYNAQLANKTGAFFKDPFFYQMLGRRLICISQFSTVFMLLLSVAPN
jgi:hypothetical protein